MILVFVLACLLCLVVGAALGVTLARQTYRNARGGDIDLIGKRSREAA